MSITWLEAAVFYRENYTSIKQFIDSLKCDSKNESTKVIKLLINEEKFKKELFAINNYKFLIDSIIKLQNPKLRL